jgi:hypothetical protein
MPDFVIQYDLRTQFIDNNGYSRSTVYDYIARRLQSRGYYRHQYSCFRIEGITLAQAHVDCGNIAAEIEARFPPAPGISIAFHYEQRTGFYVVR